jgi:hypothetical protein
MSSSEQQLANPSWWVVGAYQLAVLNRATFSRPSDARHSSARFVTATLFKTRFLREYLRKNRDHPDGVREHASLRLNILGECSWCVLLALSYLFFETIRVPDHMAAPKENAPLSEQE